MPPMIITSNTSDRVSLIDDTALHLRGAAAVRWWLLMPWKWIAQFTVRKAQVER